MQAAVQTRRSPWVILLVLCLGFFMILLDLTIVNVAIPSIIDGLHAGLDEILWVLNAYILVYAVLLITAGRLGDKYGAKRLFLIGLAVFTLASIGCSLAPSPSQLILARIVQGIGGAILTPQTLSILTNIFPPNRRGAAFGIWGAVAGVATVTGPTLGGFLVSNFSWQAVFWVNVPVGIVAFVLGIWLLPGIRLGREQNLDPVGVLLASGSLFAVVFGLIEGQRYHWGTLVGSRDRSDRRQMYPDVWPRLFCRGDGAGGMGRLALRRPANLHLAADPRRNWSRLHLRSDDDRDHAARESAARRCRVRTAQHHPSAGRRLRQCRRWRHPADPARERARQPGAGAGREPARPVSVAVCAGLCQGGGRRARGWPRPVRGTAPGGHSGSRSDPSAAARA